VSDIDTALVDSLKVLDPDGRLEKQPKSGRSESADSCHSPTYAVQQIAILFDYLVSDGQQAGRHSRLQIDDEVALVD
jgi:hypothetical protein